MKLLIAWRVALVGAASFAIWLAATWIYIKSGQPSYPFALEVIFFLATYFAFVWAFRMSLKGNGARPLLTSLLISAFVMLLWLAFSSFAVLYLHVKMGGEL